MHGAWHGTEVQQVVYRLLALASLRNTLQPSSSAHSRISSIYFESCWSQRCRPLRSACPAKRGLYSSWALFYSFAKRLAAVPVSAVLEWPPVRAGDAGTPQAQGQGADHTVHPGGMCSPQPVCPPHAAACRWEALARDRHRRA